jgi:hypothetical protein
MAYGSVVNYTGDAVVPATGKIFAGWYPCPGKVVGDLSCSAMFASSSTTSEEIADDWDTIMANIRNGTYAEKYHRGCYKRFPMDNGTTRMMTICGMGADIMEDGNPAPISWYYVGSSNFVYPWHNNATDVGHLGWETCSLRQYLNNDFYAQLPSNVRNHIRPVKKSQWAYSDYTEFSVYRQQCIDKIWIPSHDEAKRNDVIVDGITVCNDYYWLTEYNGAVAWLRDKYCQHMGGSGYSYSSVYSGNSAASANSNANSSSLDTATASNRVLFGFCTA